MVEPFEQTIARGAVTVDVRAVEGRGDPRRHGEDGGGVERDPDRAVRRLAGLGGEQAVEELHVVAHAARREDDLLGEGHVSDPVLEPHDRGLLGQQACERLGSEARAATVVDDDREGRRLRDRAHIADQPLLRAADEIWRKQQDAVGPHPGQLADRRDRLPDRSADAA